MQAVLKSKVLLARLIAASLTAILTLPTMSFAQSSDANLRGTAAPNTTITVRNVATGYTRTTTSGKDGSYALVSLPPGTYEVDAGAGTQHTVTLSVASTATLNLAATTPATSLGGVTVTATALPEVTTSEVGTLVSQREIATVPQITRNFLEFADTVPGMVFTVQQNGNTSLQSGGQAPSGINVYIDGIGQKNYVENGGITGQNSTQGNPFPQLAIGEYKVVTSNYKAEYDQISSAAVIAETKSGTNQFHGEVFGDWTDTRMRSMTPSETADRKKQPSHDKEYGFSLGGPILKDKAHFFLAYEGKEYDTPIAVAPGVASSQLISQLPASASAQLGPSSLPFKENLYFVKFDYEPTNRDRIELSGKYRHENAIVGTGTGVAASSALDQINYDRRFDIRWDHSADAWFNRLQLTYENAFFKPSAVNIGNGATYTAFDNQGQSILTTGAADPRGTQNKGQKGPAIQDDFTFNDLEWHGDHVVKMGAKYKLIQLIAQDAGEFNPQFSYDVTPTGTLSVPYQVLFPITLPGTSPVVRTNDKQFGAYIQDDWTVDEHLTLNLGARWDYEETPSYLNFVTPAAVVSALNAQDPNAPTGQTYAQSLAKGGVNVNDYISTGHNRHAQKNEFQPRFGFSYDISGDQQHVIHGGVGRSYDRTIYEILQLEQTKLALSEATITFPNPYHHCSPSPNCIAWDPAYLGGIGILQGLLTGTTAGREVDLMNNRLRTPYSDQVSIGMRNQLGEWITDVTWAQVNRFNGVVFTLGNRYPDGSFWKNGSQPWGNGIPGFGSLIIANNGLTQKTQQVLISAQKPYTPESHWGISIAYTYTRAKQNNDSQDVTDQYAFDEETIRDYPYITSAVAKHRLVVAGSNDLPWGLLLGYKLTLATPIPALGLACYGANTPNGCVPLSVTPGGSRFLSGPIFGYRSLDLQLTKNFKVYDQLSAYVRFDLLNAFNWNNYSDYTTNYGANGVLNSRPVIYNPTGNILGTPREVKLTLGVKF